MKNLRTLLLLGLGLWLPAGPLLAQDLPATTPSGILVNRVAPLAHIENMDGRAASAPVNPGRWRQAVFELQKSAEVELPWPQVRELSRTALSRATHDEVPLAMLYAEYDRQVVSGALRRSEVFSFTPLRARSHYGQDLHFSLNAESLLRHGGMDIRELRFDADDGTGFRQFGLDDPLDVQYATTGFKNLRLQAELTDGRVLEAAALLDVVNLTIPEPDETWPITASESFGGIAGTGQAYVYFAAGQSALSNPVVVVEGFDIDNSMDWPVLYDLLNQENLLEDLHNAGYDAVVLDFTEAVDPIQRNAFVLAELLDMVQAASPPGQSLALVGASMGGLVGRYALLWMEGQSLPHAVRTFISFDSPQSGANVPLGLQAWVSFFAGQSEEAEFLLSRLNAPASKQMLLYHLDSTLGTTAAPDPLQPALQVEFANLGGWPQSARRVSVINGSGAMANQGFDAGEQVIFYEYDSFLAEIIGNVWAVPDGGNQLIFDGLLDPIIGATLEDELTIADTLPWDNAPGGSRSSMDQLADTTAPFGDIIALHGNHCFIPAISALAISSNNPFYDIAGDADLLDHTPFHQVYFPATNEGHIDISPESKEWFFSEIQAGIHVSLISGDTSEGGGTATFTVQVLSAPTAPVTIALSSTDPGEGTVAASVILPAGSTEPQLVTVTGVDDASVDGSVAYSIATGSSTSADKAYHGTDPADVTVVNLDNDSEIVFSDGFEG